MLELFCPDLYIENIYKLDLNYLKQKNIRGMLIDIDNTMLPWNSADIDNKLIKWVNLCKEEGFLLCIISNNTASRIKVCANKLGIPAVSGHYKPLKRAFKEGLNILGTTPEETAAIGDQIFTDILGAKRSGLFAILVKPIGDKEFFGTKIIRKLEGAILKYMERKNLIFLNRY